MSVRCLTKYTHIGVTLLVLLILALAGPGCNGGSSSEGATGSSHTISECIGDPACGDILVCAHRGVTHFLPENTLLAFEYAIHNGADVIEVDVRQSANGEFVVMHDSTVERTTDGLGYVEDLTLKELKELRIKSEELVLGTFDQFEVRYDPGLPVPDDLTIPTFAEAVDFIDGRAIIYVDFKTGDRQALAGIIRDMGRQDQVYIAARSLAQAEELASVPGTVLMGNPNSIAEIDAFVDLGAVLLEIGFWEVTPFMVDRIHARGAKLFVNTLSEPDILIRSLVMLELGRVDLLQWAGLIAVRIFPEGVIPILPGFFDPLSSSDVGEVWSILEKGFSPFVNVGADVIQTDFLDLLVPFVEESNGR